MLLRNQGNSHIWKFYLSTVDNTESVFFVNAHVSHPALWHLIEASLSGCALTSHTHNDSLKLLMYLHFRRRPGSARVDSKARIVESL
jgi:hypothetical protein